MEGLKTKIDCIITKCVINQFNLHKVRERSSFSHLLELYFHISLGEGVLALSNESFSTAVVSCTLVVYVPAQKITFLHLTSV